MKTLSLLTALLLSTSACGAHDWYDPKCCSNQDCAPIADCSEIHTGPFAGSLSWGGYRFDKDAIFPSHDAKCHVCLYKTLEGRIHPLCIYIQQGS